MDLDFFENALNEICDPTSWKEGHYYYVKKQYSLNEHELFYARYNGSKICSYTTYLNAQIINHYFDDYKSFVKLRHDHSYGAIVHHYEIISLDRIPIKVPYTFYYNAELHNQLFSVKCYQPKCLLSALQNEIIIYQLYQFLDILEKKTHIPWLVLHEHVGSFLRISMV